MQEDLAGLFSRNLTLSAPPPAVQASPFQPPPPSQEQQIEEHQQQYQDQERSGRPTTISLVDVQRQPLTYASTHYTHSAHSAPRAQSEPRTPTVERSELFETLTRNSIDPSSLLPSQIHLYANADADQKLRLLELWRIAPPNYNPRDSTDGWYTTSLQQEEQLARIRYERLMQDRRMLGHANRPEVSAYEQLAQQEYNASAMGMPLSNPRNNYNRSSDPVWQYTVDGIHTEQEKNLVQENITKMENQYGMWTTLREIPSVITVVRPGDSNAGGDEEMVM
ncbi:MAG: hypothetical protein M1820_006488 [Bogoriella megaspora]|nr:MAG: hypothetical protein M1820_006488 [Bogoriella megaspora]